MSTIMERLLMVQDRDRKITQLTREQADIPERIRQVETRLDAHRGSLEAAREQLQKNQASMKNIETEIETRKQKISKFREQQFQIKNNDEYKALEHEIEMVETQIRAFEDKELELMETSEESRGLIAAREKDLAQEEKRVKEDQEVFKKRLGVIKGEVHDLKIDREALAKEVDPEWLARYERIFKKHGDYAIVPIENNACGGCHMNLPPHLIHDSKNTATLTSCSYCSRILYWQP